MVRHSDGVEIETSANGGFRGSLKHSVLGGESFFQNTHTATTDGHVSLAPPLPGDIVAYELSDETFYVQSAPTSRLTPNSTSIPMSRVWGEKSHDGDR